MKLLLLAGTGDAIALAARLAEMPAVTTIASFAGRTAHPVPPARTRVRTGGFGGARGLSAYLLAEKIDGVIDASHPFAKQMHRNAAAACEELGVPLIAFRRPAWAVNAQDRIHEVDDATAAAAQASAYGQRIFLTIGRQELAPFAAYDEPWFLIRCIERPETSLPLRHLLLLERGPFTREHELALLREHAIDVLVSKNSGGNATYAKIEAARACDIPVVMIKRPPRPETAFAENHDDILSWLQGIAE